MAGGYFNPSDYDAYDIGGKIFGAMQAGDAARGRKEARGYLDQNDYEGAARAVAPYDLEAAKGYLSYGNEAEEYSDRRKDKQYSRDLAPYVAKDDWDGASEFALKNNRGADEIVTLRKMAKQAQTDKLEIARQNSEDFAGALYALGELPDDQYMSAFQTTLQQYGAKGADVAQYQGVQTPAEARAAARAALMRNMKAKEIFDLELDSRKTDVQERRADAAEMMANAAWFKANKPEKTDEGIGGSGLSKEQVSTANALRDDYKAATKDFQVIADTVRRSQAYYTRANAGQPSGQGDVGLVYALAKIYDPNSVVREGEFATMAKQGGYGEQMKSWVSQALGGGFSPAIRNQIMTEIRSAYGAAKRPYDSTLQQYRANAEQLAIPPEMVVTDYGAGVALDDGPRFPTPRPEAVAALRNRPALAAEFDAKYGPGASSQYLTGRR